jgi:hypothetical protein
MEFVRRTNTYSIQFDFLEHLVIILETVGEAMLLDISLQHRFIHISYGDELHPISVLLVIVNMSGLRDAATADDADFLSGQINRSFA